MTRADFDEMAASKATDYQRMQLQIALQRVDPSDGKAFTALAGVLSYKGAAAVLSAIDMAGKVTPSGPIRSDQLQAAVTEQYPMEAIYVLRDALGMR